TEAANAGGMNRDQPVKGVPLADIARDLGPTPDLCAVVVGKTLGQVVRQVRLARYAPHDRHRAVARDEVTPVLLRLLDAHPRNEIAPRADDARREALLDQVFDPAIRGIEVLRTDAGVVRFPGETRFVRAARVKRGHVRIKAGNDLNDVEALLLPVRGQR